MHPIDVGPSCQGMLNFLAATSVRSLLVASRPNDVEAHAALDLACCMVNPARAAMVCPSKSFVDTEDVGEAELFFRYSRDEHCQIKQASVPALVTAAALSACPAEPPRCC